MQGLTVREIEGHIAQNWSTSIPSLPEWCFKFILNAVSDTIPHNTNLCKWKCQLCMWRDQFLAHVLNSCQKPFELRHYTARHDDDLGVIVNFISHHLPFVMHASADLPGHQYSFLQDIAPTEQQPDIVSSGTHRLSIWLS
jgi:hypothetical protein